MQTIIHSDRDLLNEVAALSHGPLPAQVITRWAGGCHIRVADTYDTILPPDALPEDADEFHVRIEPAGLVVFTAA